MTSADWWTRLVYDDPTPVDEMRMNHLSKRNVALARHLYESHDIRFDRQVPYDGLHAQHNEEHQTTNAWLAPHPHNTLHRSSLHSRPHAPDDRDDQSFRD